jgi:hypothetical protein
MAVRKSKAQTTRKGYNPNRKVTSSVARDVKKNADALQIGGDPMGAIKAALGAGLEPKIKPKAKSKIGNTKTKRVQGSGLKRNSKVATTSTPRKTRGGGAGRGISGGGTNGGWVTIKGNRINLGGKK